MNILFFILLTLGLIIVQSVLIPGTFFFPYSFDLLIIDILYLSLVAKQHTAILGVIVIGGVMDSISGVPFFFHIFSYLWIYGLIQLFKQLFFQHTYLFIVAVSFISTLIQHGLLILTVFIVQGPDAFNALDYQLIIRQSLFGTVMIPPSIWIVNQARKNWIAIIKNIRRQLSQKYRGEL